MNIRLSDSTQSYVHVIQKYYARLTPVPLELSNAEVLRLAVRNLVEQLAESDKQVDEDVVAIRTGKDPSSEAPDENPRALSGEERRRRYYEFFRGLISKLRGRGFDKQRKSPSTSWYYFSAGHGMGSRVLYACSFNRDSKARVALYLDSDKASNEALFNYLHGEREAIETEFGEALDWQKLDNKKACRVAVFPRDADIANDDATLDDIQDWMVKKLWSLDRALGPRLESYPI